MNTLKWLLAGLVTGLIIVSFRDLANRRWLAPSIPRHEEVDGREPVLGYDGMDQETLLDWLDDSALDEETLERLIRYERTHRRREPVLETLEEMLG